ncbi:MAG: hypothetical protein JO033_17600 [Acidobacteriaceae bacterium]|nr:hypothetical protein [Acidobacteriaceae bacterium]MBV9500826.1 hypothetical protein [Acidobacteriaceae bacterium]
MSLVSRLWWRRYLHRNGCPWDELALFQELAPDQQRVQLAERLLRQVQYFGRREDALPEWRDAARITDRDELWRIWPQLPIVTKQMLNDRFRPDEIKRRFGCEGRADSTGGSTGEPTHFFHDRHMLRAITAQITYSMLGMGWRPGMPIVSIWGSERDIGKQVPWKIRLHYSMARQYNVDGYSLDQGTVDRVLSILHRHKHVAMYGFTSMLEFVAEQVLDRGVAIEPEKVKTAWNGGEILTETQNQVFRTAFGVPLLNRYGGRELSTMACQFSPTAPLTVLRPWLFLEVLDESGKRVEPGESGRLIWTSTICRGSPFLRYEVEDWGTFQAPHQCESGIHALLTIDGRSAGVVRLPNGMKINNIYWNHFFKEFREVRQFQVVIRKRGDLHLLLRGERWSREREQYFRGTLSNFLHNLPVEIEWVEQIPRTNRGKRIQVIRES